MRIAQTLAATIPAVLLFVLLAFTGWPAGAQAPPPASDAPPPATDAPPVTDSDDDQDDAGDDDDADPDVESEPTVKRVIIVVDRYTTTAGEVIEQDDDIIVIRNRFDKVESFTKARVLSIIPLLEVTEPRPGILTMRNGQSRRVLIIEDDYDHVTVEIEGIRTTFERNSVSHVTFEPTLEERYREMRLAITAGSREHWELCKWLMDQRQYQLAVKELEQFIAEGAPDHEAPRLLRTARAQLILMEDAADRDDPADAPDDLAADAAAQIVRDLSANILSDHDVNHVRVWEIDIRNPPKVLVKPETIRKLQEDYGTSPLIPATTAERTQMFRADDLQLVKLMFELRARDLYPEIEVQSEPYSLNLFRDRVHHAWLVTNCATSRCHGGPDAGRLFLHNRNTRDARVWMSNFLTLERLEIDPVHPLINYQDPEMSLVLQYALNRTEARMPHPEVRGWRPVFPRKNRQFWESVQWIDAMMQPRPEYPVEYEPPVPPAARGRTTAPGDRTDR